MKLKEGMADGNVIFLLVLVAVEGFDAGSERIARCELIKRFERRMTKVTKYFDEV